jgi:hypothetical protein
MQYTRQSIGNKHDDKKNGKVIYYPTSGGGVV